MRAFIGGVEHVQLSVDLHDRGIDCPGIGRSAGSQLTLESIGTQRVGAGAGLVVDQAGGQPGAADEGALAFGRDVFVGHRAGGKVHAQQAAPGAVGHDCAPVRGLAASPGRGHTIAFLV